MCTWLEFGMSFIPSPNMHTQSQSHGKIVRKLSKRLKVGSRKATMVTMPTELVPVRPSSPVLYAARPVPLHQHSQLEQSDSGSSGNTTANSLGTCIKKDLHVCYCAFHKLSWTFNTFAWTGPNQHLLAPTLSSKWLRTCSLWSLC